MGKRWRIRPHDADRIAALERSARIPAVVAQLLVCRGIYDPNEVHQFLDPKLTGLRDPDELPGIDVAADRLHTAVRDGQRIVIYGDYDADGMTATAILYRCLTLLGANVGYYVPCRVEEGYGLNSKALEKLAARDTKVVVTVDCGITSVHEAEVARKLGIDLIVTDHHAMGETLPDALALVHPRLPGHSYPFGGLCGAGVAFKLAWAICQRASEAKRVGERMRNFLLEAIGLAAIGTVADVVPLLDENRIIVYHGLHSLKNRASLGLSRMMQITQLNAKPVLGAEDIGFTIAPRLNAAGRLGQAQLAVELLTTESQDRAKALADYIHELNESRASLERSIYRAANKQAKEDFDPQHDPALVLAGRGWHPGVIGIVAGRLAEQYNRPVVLIALDNLGVKPGSGSARSAAGLNLHAALTDCSDHLARYGGHAAAAGLQIEEKQIEAFRADFCEYATRETPTENLEPEITVDAETALAQLTLNAAKQIERIAPFGQDNPRPTLCASNVKLADAPRLMGSGERHLSLKLKQHNVVMRAVAFGRADWADELAKAGDDIDIAYRPVINHFRGRSSVELHLVDWRPAAQKDE